MGSWKKWKILLQKLEDIVENAAETLLDYIAVWRQGPAADERYASSLLQKYCLLHQNTKHIVFMFNKLAL